MIKKDKVSSAALKKILFRALFDAGRLIKPSLMVVKRIRYKSEANLVTEVDKAAEVRIIRLIKKNFPDHAILAEESQPHGNHRYKWIIDPIDGTTNFAHTFPVACTSIGIEEDGKMRMGGVYDPFRDELFFAEAGKGAYLNGKPISVSRTKSLRQSLLCTGFPYDRKIFASTYLRIFGGFMTRCHGIRRTGSAAIDICYVACGRFDGFWELKLNAWDTSAASLICQEAGGVMSNFKGDDYSIYQEEALSSNPFIQREMLAVLKKYYLKG